MSKTEEKPKNTGNPLSNFLKFIWDFAAKFNIVLIFFTILILLPFLWESQQNAIPVSLEIAWIGKFLLSLISLIYFICSLILSLGDFLAAKDVLKATDSQTASPAKAEKSFISEVDAFAFLVGTLIRILGIFVAYYYFTAGYQMPTLENLQFFALPIGLVVSIIVIGFSIWLWERNQIIEGSTSEDATSKSRARKTLTFFESIITGFAKTIRAMLFLLISTINTLFPSPALTSKVDEVYDGEMKKKLGKIVDDLELDAKQKEIIKENWIEQLEWTNKRATVERNANELIRWWLIVLGVLIPVLSVRDDPYFRLAVSVLGIFVAILTAISQFRRPDERWRHYRIINENYLIEFWSFVAKSDAEYADKNHSEVFQTFNARMKRIREEDAKKFFGEVVAGSTELSQQYQKAFEVIKNLESEVEALKNNRSGNAG